MHSRIGKIIALGLGLGLVSLQAQEQGDADVDNVFDREIVPPEIMAEATNATQLLGNEILKGNMKYAVETMYPRYRKQAAKMMGGDAQVQAAFLKLFNDLAQQGVEMTAFAAEDAFSAYHTLEHDEWLVFVPTVRQLRGVDSQTGKVRVLELRDFQIAVKSRKPAKEGEKEPQWSFINGRGLKVQFLRQLFPTLPADKEILGWPEESVKEVK